MGRDKDALKRGNDVALKVFNAGVQNCQNEDELAGFVRMVCTLSCKMIHGMEGQGFKKDFLRGAISDKEMISPVKVNKH